MMPIGIGILGTGYMALNAYLPAFRRQGATVQTIWGRNEQRVREIAGQHALPHIHSDEQALINDPTVDAVVIATPNVYHQRALKATVAAGKAVLCEKPLGMNLAQAEEMHAAVQRAGVFHAVPFIWRLPDQAQEIKALIENGFLGQIYECHAVFSVGVWASAQSSLGWRGQAELAGAGVLADLGGHAADLASWYVGELDQVVAQGTTHIPVRQVPENEIENVTVVDACNLLARFKTGAQGSFHLSYIDQSRDMFLRLELHGSRGAILYELEMEGENVNTRLGLREVGNQKLAWTSKTQPFAEIIDRLCAGFLAGVQTGASEIPSVADGVRAQAIIETATSSISTKKWESV